ncbi:hypothetical protein CH254_23605 [Rhodococcus sp. 06-412-2C]|uniref:hypothetical protein n=1 Tax=unclassified Rhodococcus (in: high G+C Gram-positive bacteria) TaxID=192944 RepID=UPI000B9A78D9|nr:MULTISPECIES: hypothetical protein [unclassified Rhodococcus (in: high G+C Gram-positive bacteria)]OZC83881.1 hypothetical protein CH254_23605 [Rhodococcus sp. 06-412-2C]OZC94069.1 hypothetical protein CH279_21690 [Rhodococcus sp. 06-412-2B]
MPRPRPTEAELDELYSKYLIAFVLRARRVKAHSMYLDPEMVRRVGEVEFRLERDSECVWLLQELPPEEVVESAAARLRPLILQDEDAHHGKMISALKRFLRGVTLPDVPGGPPTDSSVFLSKLKGEWAEFDSNGRIAQAYSVQSSRASDGQTSEVLADNVLAFAWIYGDVVHGDSERLRETEQHGVKERFRAAAPLVCRLMEMAVATLHAIEWLRFHGLLPLLPDAAFEQEVVVTDSTFRQKADVYMAPVGTEMPNELTSSGGLPKLGPDWQQLS